MYTTQAEKQQRVAKVVGTPPFLDGPQCFTQHLDSPFLQTMLPEVCNHVITPDNTEIGERGKYIKAIGKLKK